MKKEVFNYVRHILQEYNRVPGYIDARERAIMRPPISSVDENVGGGKGSKVDRGVENMAVTLADDASLNFLKESRQTVSFFLNRCDDETQEIIERLYIKGDLTMDGVAKAVNLSERQCRRKRTAFFGKIADAMGFY